MQVSSRPKSESTYLVMCRVYIPEKDPDSAYATKEKKKKKGEIILAFAQSNATKIHRCNSGKLFAVFSILRSFLRAPYTPILTTRKRKPLKIDIFFSNIPAT